MSGAYYNEFDPYAAQWLRNLIAAGHIAPGDVDERSIVDVQPDDLKSYTQCHFFAGISGWSYAARLVGFPDDRPLWTGSCPCQPFSKAGRRKAQSDDRHLWPHFFRLIRERRPPVVFGEQVAEAVGVGWLDDVASDLEGDGYAFGAAIVPAWIVGAPHDRPRLWFVADRIDARVAGPVASSHLGRAGQWEWCGEADLQAIGNAPFVSGDRWPQPLIRSVDGRVPARVGRLRAFGNAIVPQVAAEVIGAYMDVRAAA